MIKKIAILGSTGSICKSLIQIIKKKLNESFKELAQKILVDILAKTIEIIIFQVFHIVIWKLVNQKN